MSTTGTTSATVPRVPPLSPMCTKPVYSDEELVLTSMIMQTALLLTLAHFLHRFLNRFGQPSAISHMLAGIILGPSALGSSKLFAYLLLPQQVAQPLISALAALGQQLFLFLTGIETDIPYVTRSGRRACIVALGGAAISTTMGGILSPLIYWQFNAYGSFPAFIGSIMLVFASTSTPLLVRMCAELKLSNSEVGRLAISVSLLNDAVAMILLGVIPVLYNIFSQTSSDILRMFLAVAIMVASVLVVRPLVRYLNRRNRLRRRIRMFEAAAILIFVCGTSSVVEALGCSSAISAFMMGLMFSSEGGTARTLEERLSYLVQNFALPIFFGFNAMQLNFSYIHGRIFWGLVTVVVFGALSKAAGTIVAAQYLGMPMFEGLVLGLLLNVKGHVDVILVSLAFKDNVLPQEAAVALVARVVVNSLITGPVASVLVRNQRKGLKYQSVGLEFQRPEAELRVLACVHSHEQLPTFLNLIRISTGTDNTPIAAYVMQMVELTNKTTNAMIYHQQEDWDHGDEDDLDPDQTGQINSYVDAFIQETGITVRQVTTVSPFTSMHEDVCRGSEDVRACLVLLPHHSSQRPDRTAVAVKEGLRRMNECVLTHAPCTVGILVDRGLSGAAQTSANKPSYQLMVLFFGGSDDREAVALGCRLALNPSVIINVVRFMPSRANYDAGLEVQSSRGEEVLMAINEHEEGQADEAFLSSFYTRFVVSGMATYAVKMVENSEEILTALRQMDGLYSLFLTGRGRRNQSLLVRGLSKWEQSSELGPVGTLLASPDILVNGSVLVLQQHGIFEDCGSTVRRRSDDDASSTMSLAAG